eukprot:2339124-Pleurochrysis_carterae.AAC.2
MARTQKKAESIFPPSKDLFHKEPSRRVAKIEPALLSCAGLRIWMQKQVVPITCAPISQHQPVPAEPRLTVFTDMLKKAGYCKYGVVA